MAEPLDRHPRNCAGPFYVENGQCISCGAPESEADGIMSHDAEEHCFFVRQPQTEDETNAAVRGVWASCCGAVRYGGNDPQLLTRFEELGRSSQCDHQLPHHHTQIVRNCVRFEYLSAKGLLSRRKYLRQIIDEIAACVRKDPETECFAFRCWWNEASFRFRWGRVVNKGGFTVRFGVTSESTGRWLLRISGHEVAHTGFAIQLDKAMRKNAMFRSIRWFEENELPEGGGGGKPHPY